MCIRDRPYGYVTCTNMDPSGSYHKLAAYFIKYSDKTMRKMCIRDRA